MANKKATYPEGFVSIESEFLLLTPDKASRLARHYLGLVQILREIAGEPILETGTQRRKEERGRAS